MNGTIRNIWAARIVFREPRCSMSGASSGASGWISQTLDAMQTAIVRTCDGRHARIRRQYKACSRDSEPASSTTVTFIRTMALARAFST